MLIRLLVLENIFEILVTVSDYYQILLYTSVVHHIVPSLYMLHVVVSFLRWRISSYQLLNLQLIIKKSLPIMIIMDDSIRDELNILGLNEVFARDSFMGLVTAVNLDRTLEY